ncbi:hypothetical protein ASPZODRAFT_135305 [Penicilliopsis zonata CBS 506.65]|uniref:Zn(2)-C6 fungal-type domain-containing protein n=1 Tax=Penicilliopsis zonata CBS 506.65 TaxID=1073090 RepID=A0A1L9SBF5_9EURO|nr:hypothetical protein ASPZODRAFT_135305 [Penicilliopsis zonata CBS 506.65]OJJ44491.1 hypothetical protein ASPZODRAFT_135305 [Penicilliopsis zonata CBS 506.65]
MGDGPTDEGTGSGLPKRQPPSASANEYPRKRAAIACELCRLRKTRCDNVRPTCSLCRQAGAVCKYTTASDATPVTYEPQPSALLERLNYAISLLERPSNRSPSPTANPATTGELGVPRDAIFAECMLSWSVLQGFGSANSSSLLWSGCCVPEVEKKNTGMNTPSTGVPSEAEILPSINPHDFVALVQRYLSLVHVKNPILDIDRLQQTTRRVVEEGCAWDGGTALVLLACALAVLVTELEDTHNAEDNWTMSGRDLPSDRETADVYYMEARKRLGLLDLSLEAAQCQFLCGIYEMCRLRVVEAWSHYQQAAMVTQMLLLQRMHRAELPIEPKPLERLYYSCLRTHNHFQIQAPLPLNTLSYITLPNPFPSPPLDFGLDAEMLPPYWMVEGGDSAAFRLRNVRGWFYYLAEISALRTSTRIIRTLYSHEETWWLDHIVEVVQQVRIFEEEANSWFDHLPATVRWAADAPRTELTTILYFRTLNVKTMLFHPMLYFAIHQRTDHPQWGEAAALAAKGLEACAAMILFNGKTQWRHGGLWFVLRSLFRNALSILAAVRSGRFDCSDNWMSLIELAITNLSIWELEALDVLRMRKVLDQILVDTRNSSQKRSANKVKVVWP